MDFSLFPIFWQALNLRLAQGYPQAVELASLPRGENAVTPQQR